MEGDDDGTFIRLGEHALRVRTDDDEVDLAYYFIDEDAAAASPDRLAYLLHDTWPLPPTPPRPARSSSMACRSVPSGIAPSGPEAVFSVRLCWDPPGIETNLDLAGALVFPGLTLPGFAARLRAVDAPGTRLWPHDARLLRALIAPNEEDAGVALARYARLPGYDPSPAGLDRVSAHHEIHREALEMMAPELPSGR